MSVGARGSFQFARMADKEPWRYSNTSRGPQVLMPIAVHEFESALRESNRRPTEFHSESRSGLEIARNRRRPNAQKPRKSVGHSVQIQCSD
jgi:hypothetical protein